MPLDADDELPVTNLKSKLNINNENSSAHKIEQSKIPFEKRAEEANDQNENYKRKAYELGKSFLKLIEDKTLVNNKSPMAKDIERETMLEVIKLGMDMNADENQPESMGSIGVITLILKGIVIQRDKINSLEYKVLDLERKLAEISRETPISNISGHE